MTPQLVYKASERAGVTVFEPRPFWATADFARSGSAADPSRVPPGATVFHGVYATREEFVPFYFAPRRTPRFSIDPRANEAAAPLVRRLVGRTDAARVIWFPMSERAKLVAHAVSLYVLDSAPFELLPTREFLAKVPVTPLREVRYESAMAALDNAGWEVSFVKDLPALRGLRSDLLAAGVTRYSAEKL
jgi:hypothetical protein